LIDALRIGTGQRVERHNLLCGGVEHDRIVCPMFGNPINYRRRQVAVHVEHCQAAAGEHVLVDEVQEERGFAGSRRTDNIKVPAAGIDVQT
jgi:hypothetical protein